MYYSFDFRKNFRFDNTDERSQLRLWNFVGKLRFYSALKKKFMLNHEVLSCERFYCEYFKVHRVFEQKSWERLVSEFLNVHIIIVQKILKNVFR